MYNEYHLLAVAIVFTIVGMKWVPVERIVNATIDTLIKEGYIKTKGEGDEMILLKHWEK